MRTVMTEDGIEEGKRKDDDWIEKMESEDGERRRRRIQRKNEERE